MKKQQTVPIVQQDLSHEETIVQIAFSLEALEKIVSNIFSNVECAIERKKKRLHNIQNRCAVAKEKVERLVSINKSIKVFSCYKYPCPRTEIFYKDPLYRVIEINEPTVKVKSSSLPSDKLSLKEKLKFYHVRDSSITFKNNCENSPLDGLGELPSECSQVNSVLLYNTNQNLYKHYKIVDPLGVITKQVGPIANDKTSIIESDPISFGSGNCVGYKSLHNYFYSPSVQDVPDIEAPINLPRLTGIAGDLNYSDDTIRNIEYEDVQLDKELNFDIELHVEKGLSYPESSPLPQPPPHLPPPPPLPPPLACELKDEVQEPSQKNTENLVSCDVRANLMEAIRQAGGKSKLKRVSVEKIAPFTSQSKSLMDDLHEKLHMRRKGISGKIDNTDGMLDRIVSMIPPPPTLVKQPQEDDDVDWED